MARLGTEGDGLQRMRRNLVLTKLLTKTLRQVDSGDVSKSRAHGRAESASTLLFLIVTMIFGLAFLGVKGFEYHEHWVDMKVPLFSGHWDYSEAPQFARPAQILFCFYFFMTGFHALHMVVGVGLLTTIF